MSAASQYTPREMLDRLVAFETVSRDSNLELIEFVTQYLSSHGFTAQSLSSPCGEKANLYVRIGPEVEGGVVLSGHTDVVPIDGQPWDTDPFKLTERDNRLYGRGTCDMKGFLAICLALVPQMQQLNRPIYLALSYDEEIGCLGAPAMIEQLKREAPTIDAVFVGEPTSMRVVSAHKGILHFDTDVHGLEVHSSQQHRGVPAVMYAARLIQWLGDQQRVNAGRACCDSEFEPPYSTLHCGTVQGGTAHNITARHCHFVTDIRALPEEDAAAYLADYERFVREEIEPEMQRICPSTCVDIKVHSNVPGYCAPNSCEAIALAKQLSGQNSTDVAPYAAEAGQFQRAGFAVAMCGPGSIDQAHQPNEFISLDQLQRGTQFIERLIRRQQS